MKEMYKGLNIIGSDETGVGDYLSPLVACACFVPRENVKKLRILGVKDSKKLTRSNIFYIAAIIKKNTVFKVAHLTQAGYNQLNKSFNAHELKMFLHMKAINALEAKIKKVDLIIIDKFSSENFINQYYNRLGQSNFGFKKFKAKVTLVERGEEEHVAVAAASILAREYFLEMMKRQDKKYNLIFPLGTNKTVEKFAKDFIKIYGIEELNNVAKISFKTTKKVLNND